MGTSCLIVHKNSVSYVRNILATLIEALQDNFDKECQMVVCSSIDSAEIGDAEFIFVIGEGLERFRRISGRRYIFLNFSVVAMLGNPFLVSIRGAHLIRRKNLLLRKKLDLFDALMDFYPPQTRYLARTLDIPVFGFVPWVSPMMLQQKVDLADRPYDICFVGSISTRRLRVLEKLKAAGCVLSPSSGVTFEDIAGQSRCTLNIHMQRSNHLEIPRVMGALASASALITENSFGIQELLPKGLVKNVPYTKLVDATLTSLANPESLRETEELGRHWYSEVGAPLFKMIFISSVKEIQLILKHKYVLSSLGKPIR